MINNRLLFTFAIILVGLNLRPAMAALGPLLEQIMLSTGASFEMAGLWTSFPIIVMGIVALQGNAIYRLGMHRGISLGLLLILLACAARAYWFTVSGLLITAAIAGLGIGIIQVLMPGFIKQSAPKKADRAMAIFVTAIVAGAAIAAFFSPYFALHLLWSETLAVWGILALISVCLWQRIPQPSANFIPSPTHQTSFLHFCLNARICRLALFFGIITCIYTLLLTWLAPFYIERGYQTITAGRLLAIMTLWSALFGIIVTLFVSRWHDRRWPLLAGLILELLGFLLLLSTPQTDWLVIMLLGSGLGILFPLSLIVTLDHSNNPELAGKLTAFVQGVGYILAGVMPYLAGIVRDLLGSFALAWIIMMSLTLLMIPLVWRLTPVSVKNKSF